jgi:hypothetical protein
MLLAVLWLLDNAVYFFTQTQWFAAQNASSIWRLRASIQTSLFILNLGLMTGIAVLTLRPFWPRPQARETSEGGTRLDFWLRIYQHRSQRLIQLGLGVFIVWQSWQLAVPWTQWIDSFSAPPLGIREKYFGFDAALYMFRLPIWHVVHDAWWRLASWLWLGAAMLHAGQTLAEFPSRLPSPRLLNARRWLAALGACWFIGLAFAYGVNLLDAVIEQHESAVNGFFSSGYTFVSWHVERPLDMLGVVLSLLSAGWLLQSTWRATQKRVNWRRWPVWLSWGAATYLAPGLLAWLLGGLVQNLLVEPDPSRENWFREERTRLTRAAWQLDRTLKTSMQLVPLSPDTAVPDEPLWDDESLFIGAHPNLDLETSHSFRIDRDDQGKVVALQAWESRDQNQSRWKFETAPATLGGTEGQPLLRPGAVTSVYGPSWQAPIAEPQAQDVKLDNVLQRLLWAWRLRALHLLWTPQTRVAFPRDVRERASELFPFLTLDGEPYPIRIGERWHWMMDATVATTRFPGADLWMPPDGDSTVPRVLRDAAKIVIDVQTGQARLWASDTAISQTAPLQHWEETLPQALRPFAEMPSAVLAQRRYPPMLWQAQWLLNIANQGKATEGGYQAGDVATLIVDGELVRQGVVQEAASQRVAALWQVEQGSAYGQARWLQFADATALPSPNLPLPLLKTEEVLDSLNRSSNSRLQWELQRGKVLLVPLQGRTTGTSVVVTMQPIWRVRNDRVASSLGTQPQQIQLWGVAMGDAARPGQIAGVGRTLDEARRQFWAQQSQRSSADMAAALRESMTLHSEAQKAMREGNWARAGYLWKQQYDQLRKLYGATQKSR